MNSLITFLQGKKTYGVAALAAIVITAHLLGYVDTDLANSILAFLVPAGLITLKAGQSRIEDKL